MTTQQTRTSKVNTVSCILLNILVSIYRFESFTWIPIQILYIHGHFKLRSMKLHVLMIKLTPSLGRLCFYKDSIKQTKASPSIKCPLTETKNFKVIIFNSESVWRIIATKRCDFIGELSRGRCAHRSFSYLGKKIWLCMHLRNLGSDTVVRTSSTPSC